jgi:hypothetical protein
MESGFWMHCFQKEIIAEDGDRIYNNVIGFGTMRSDL